MIADRPPERDRYGAGDTVARSTLVGRGWTTAHIERLLKDAAAPSAEGQPPRYDRVRVEAAERDDPSLRERLTRHRKRRSARQARAVSRRVDAGQVVWRRREGRWVLFGRGLVQGQTVDATRRGGRVERKRVAAVLEVTADGTYAEAVRVPVRRRRRRGSTIRQLLLTGEHPPGAVVSVGAEQVQLLAVRRVVIGATDPARWGAHLAGHVGQVGTRATCRTLSSTSE